MQASNNTSEEVKKIKQGFRLLMNGITARSIRDKGVEYHLNWGANALHLKEMAADYEPNYELAVALWKEDIRECKIMATMLMPPSDFSSDLAMLWIEQLRSQELTEYLVFNLLQNTPYASDLAFQLIAENSLIRNICGFNLLGRLFSKNMAPCERDINEFIDQAISALKDQHVSLRHTALNALLRFSDLGEMYRLIVVNALKPMELDYLL